MSQLPLRDAMSAPKAFQESKTDMRELQRGTEAKSITPARVYWFALHVNLLFLPIFTSLTFDSLRPPWRQLHLTTSTQVSIYYVRQQHIQHHQSWISVQLRPIATESSSFLRLPGPSDTSQKKVNSIAQVEDRGFENHSRSISPSPSKRIYLSACHNII